MHEESKTGLIFAALLGLAAALVGLVANKSKSAPPPPAALDVLKVDVDLRFASVPAMDLPEELRTRNWGGGSCVHAATVSLLKWQGQYEMAEWWRKNYIGGESSSRLVRRMEDAGLRYAYTMNGDEAFLEWAMRTRRGAGIFFKPNHAINIVGLDSEYAYLLDNNNVREIERVPRA